ncbi:594763d1-c941-42dc-bc98-46c255bfde2a [Thermothielavioides terrestris]|uniref:594763d1-c941-42dc-bc98-46c255bfde2a n=1 Tax=Thermothielavioides terrestris TaxID=2587410 RepID=A0A3S4C5N0_9PEZI|nr:594763d1-c941-42dc-bc98-46c255bfde2a [Thermothielavioides terrestris]
MGCIGRYISVATRLESP